MNTNYPTSNFNYNTDFHYDYNIFNNQNIGIGTFNPQHTLDIKGNLSTIGNINIHGNMIFKNKYPNQNKHFLEYNVNTNRLTPLPSARKASISVYPRAASIRSWSASLGPT